MVKRSKQESKWKQLSTKRGTTFKGWIDVRDLKRTKVRENGTAFIPERSWVVYDKHWYDGKCVQVEIKILGRKR